MKTKKKNETVSRSLSRMNEVGSGFRHLDSAYTLLNSSHHLLETDTTPPCYDFNALMHDLRLEKVLENRIPRSDGQDYSSPQQRQRSRDGLRKEDPCQPTISPHNDDVVYFDICLPRLAKVF